MKIIPNLHNWNYQFVQGYAMYLGLNKVDSGGVGSHQDILKLNAKWCILGTFKTKSIKEGMTWYNFKYLRYKYSKLCLKQFKICPSCLSRYSRLEYQ